MLVPMTADPWNDHNHAPTPPKLRNIRLSTTISTKTVFVVVVVVVVIVVVVVVVIIYFNSIYNLKY